MVEKSFFNGFYNDVKLVGEHSVPEISKITTIHSSSNLTEEQMLKLIKGKRSPVAALISDVHTFTANEATFAPYRHKCGGRGKDVSRCVSLNSGEHQGGGAPHGLLL